MYFYFSYWNEKCIEVVFSSVNCSNFSMFEFWKDILPSINPILNDIIDCPKHLMLIKLTN